METIPQEDRMTPQHVTLITLCADHLARSRAFHGSLASLTLPVAT